MYNLTMYNLLGNWDQIHLSTNPQFPTMLPKSLFASVLVYLPDTVV
jgi:hypothetical protein